MSVSWSIDDESRPAVGALDRASLLRKRPDELRAGWAGAQVLLVDGAGRMPVDGERLRLVDADGLAPEPPPGAVFLGIREARQVWALRAEQITEPSSELRGIGGALDSVEWELATSAVALLGWHDRARFSPVDGSLTDPSPAGWSRISRSTGAEIFPRTDPAMICLVHDGADQALLVRQRVWPERRHSVLAGFVEAGETLEACVVREIREEVGIGVADVTYLGSQSWPFPRSLMVGFSAIADPSQPLRFLDGEIAEGRWFTRDEVVSALAAGDWIHPTKAPLLLPGPSSISRRMIAGWAASH